MLKQLQIFTQKTNFFFFLIGKPVFYWAELLRAWMNTKKSKDLQVYVQKDNDYKN